MSFSWIILAIIKDSARVGDGHILLIYVQLTLQACDVLPDQEDPKIENKKLRLSAGIEKVEARSQFSSENDNFEQAIHKGILNVEIEISKRRLTFSSEIETFTRRNMQQFKRSNENVFFKIQVLSEPTVFWKAFPLEPGWTGEIQKGKGGRGRDRKCHKLP